MKVKKIIAAGSKGVTSGNKNDCAVRSLCNATGMPYVAAYALCKQYGRPDGDGMRYDHFHKMLTENSFKLLGTFGSTQNAKYFGYNVDCSYTKYPGISIEKALTSVLAEGTFIVMRRGHYFCVIDGEIIDGTQNTGAMSVQIVWKLED